jgi:hypothetical protein
VPTCAVLTPAPASAKLAARSATQSPPPSRRRFGRSLLTLPGLALISRKALIKWVRNVHLYVTLFGCALLAFFAITGFMLNHEDWFSPTEPMSRTVQGTIPVDLLGSPGKEGDEDAQPVPGVAADRLAIVELLRKDFGAVGALSSFEEQDDVRVIFKRPGTEVEATIKREDGKAEVTVRSQGLVGVMVDLHRGKSSGNVWSLFVIDGLCILVLVMSVSGIYMWQTLRGRGHYGIYVLGLGGALVGAVYLLCVP